MVTAELERPVEAKKTPEAPKPKKYKFRLNYSTYVANQGYEHIFVEVYNEQGEVVGKKPVDLRAKPPKIYRALSPTGKKVHPDDCNIIETDLELDVLFPTLPSTNYPLQKFTRLSGPSGVPLDDAAQEAYRLGVEEGMKRARGEQPVDSIGDPVVAAPVESASGVDIRATYEAMTEDDLRQLAASEEIDLNGCRTKKQVIDRFMHS
jgi:hypothetical protein